MKFIEDQRSNKDPLGVESTETRKLIDHFVEQITLNLAKATASNYNFQNYGANQRIIFESVAKIVAEILLDISDLQDDYSYQDIRPEYISSKLLTVLFEDQNNPNIADTDNLILLCTEVIQSLLQGSTEPSILNALESTKDGDSIEFRKLNTHILSVLSSTLRYTGNPSDDSIQTHRHLVNTKSIGLGSTSTPIGENWGGDLHFHEIVDGVVQEANGHTHPLQLGISSNSLEEQENLRKVLRTTKPAHVKIGEISSVLGESITTPSTSTVTFDQSGNPTVDSETLVYSLSNFYQENMRKARVGTWENVITGYYKDQKFRISNALVESLDVISIEGKQRKVISVTEVSIEDGAYQADITRQSKTVNVVVSNGFISVDETIGNNEIFLINGDAYFAERRARGIAYLKAKEISLDSPLDLVQGLYDISFLNYTWRTLPKKYRSVSITVRSHVDGFFYAELKASQRRTFKSLPVLKSDFTVDPAYTLLEYYPYYYSVAGISNSISLKFEPDNLSDLQNIDVLIPIGEDDLLNFVDLNSEQFVLNSARKSRRPQTEIKNSSANDNFSPTIGLYPTLPVEPRNTETFLAKNLMQGSFGLNTASQTLPPLNTNYDSNSHFTLNKLQNISTNTGDVRDYAVKQVTVKKNFISFYELGFVPDFVIHIKDTDGTEYNWVVLDRGLSIYGIEENVSVEVKAISTKPLVSPTWTKGEILGEGQVLSEIPYDSQDRDTPTPEEIMYNPSGRVLDNVFNVDKQRNDLYTQDTKTRGIEAEEIFFEDDFTRIEFSGIAFTKHQHCIQDNKKTLKPNLICNQSDRLIGIRSILDREDVSVNKVKITLLDKATVDAIV